MGSYFFGHFRLEFRCFTAIFTKNRPRFTVSVNREQTRLASLFAPISFQQTADILQMSDVARYSAPLQYGFPEKIFTAGSENR
nr:unnamed protein product [Callosobruchus analis]